MVHDTKASALELVEMGFKVFPLQRHSKKPATKHGFKDYTEDPEDVRENWPDGDKFNIGVTTGNGLLTIDVDRDDDEGYDGHETILAWEREHGELPETASFITGRGGYQLLYHVDREIRIDANEKLHVDVRCDGGYFMAPGSVHPNGNIVEWENHPQDVPIADADDNVYALINFITDGAKEKRKKFRMPKEIREGGRNKTLAKYGCSMQGKGYSDDLIASAIIGANITRCKPPLEMDEVDDIIESVLNYNKGMSDEAKAKKRGRPKKDDTDDGERIYSPVSGKVYHNRFAKKLILEDKACFVDGAPAVWDGHRYATGWDEIDRAILNHMDECKQRDQKEIRHYIHLKAPRIQAADPFYIAAKNGLVEMGRGLVETSEDKVITNVIPWDYDPDAYDEITDHFLDRISNGDKNVRANLEEVIGLCLYRSNEIGQCPVLLGSGSNGKSTFIAALRNLLGPENVSSLDIGVIGKQFQTGRLLGKLANLGDDISNEFLKGDVLAVFKKIVTGEWVYTDVKNGDGFEFKPYCTLVFSANEFPKLGDSSEGMMRRLFPIPFDAVFKRSDPDYNPQIYKDVTSENAAKYLFKLGAYGLQRVIFQNGMTPNNRSENMVNEVRIDNNNILQWLEDEELSPDNFVGTPTAEAFERYSKWCEQSNTKPFTQRNFTSKFCAAFNFESVTKWFETAQGRVSRKAFKQK